MNVGDTVEFIGEDPYVLYGYAPYGIVTEFKPGEQPDLAYVRWGGCGYSSRTDVSKVKVIEPNPYSVGDIVLKGDEMFLIEGVDGIFVTLDNGGGQEVFAKLEKVPEETAEAWRTVLTLGNALRAYASDEGWCGDYEQSIQDSSGLKAFSDRARRVKPFDVTVDDTTINADHRTDIKRRVRDALQKEFSRPGESCKWGMVEAREVD